VRELQEAEGRVITYERAAGQVAEASSRLSPLASAFRAMRAKGIIEIGTQVAARELADEVRTILHDGRNRIAAGSEIERFQSNVLRSRTVKLAEGIERVLGDAWRRWALGRIPPLDDDILAVLEQVGRAADVRQIRRAKASLSERLSTLPLTDAAIAAFEREAADLSRAIQEMPIPGQVRSFLLAVPRGAQLELLTDEVSNWLRDNGLQASFVVIPKRQNT
jgi:hypothetical protein